MAGSSVFRSSLKLIVSVPPEVGGSPPVGVLFAHAGSRIVPAAITASQAVGRRFMRPSFPFRSKLVEETTVPGAPCKEPLDFPLTRGLLRLERGRRGHLETRF